MLGGQQQFSSLTSNLNGASKPLDSAYTNINNVQSKIFPEEQQLVRLSELTPGRIICFDTTLSGINKKTDFIVLGPSKEGDTILCLQRYVYYAKRTFNSVSTFADYEGSNVDTYLTSTTEQSNYKSMLSEIACSCLMTTTITTYCYGYSIPGIGYEVPSSTTNISRDIFLMSYTEAGFTDSTLAIEGNSYLDALKTATKTTVDNDARKAITESGKFNSIDTNHWWLRSQKNISGEMPLCRRINEDGSTSSDSPTGKLFVRPILSFDPDTIVNSAPITAVLIGK